MPVIFQSQMNTFSVRLSPGADLKKELLQIAVNENIQAGCVVTCVGSLTQVHLRPANKNKGIKKKGHFEIISLAGSLSHHGVHLHLSVADGNGKMLGGHLLDDNLIYTTAEVVIGNLPALIFKREFDKESGYAELAIKKRTSRKRK